MSSTEDIEELVKHRGGNVENDIWRAECDRLLNILADADGPQTADEVGMLAIDLSQTQVARRLRYLVDHGKVKRVRDPDDRRVVRYALASE